MVTCIYFSEANYSIAWLSDTSADYKLFHSDDANSIIVDSMKGTINPWRYPFCDIFIYVYNKTDDMYVYRNKWRKINPKAGLRTLDLSGGTKLTTFGDFEMRVSLDVLRYINDYYKNWRYVGVTQWYNHMGNYMVKTVPFEMIPRLYAPALPFN